MWDWVTPGHRLGIFKLRMFSSAAVLTVSLFVRTRPPSSELEGTLGSARLLRTNPLPLLILESSIDRKLRRKPRPPWVPRVCLREFHVDPVKIMIRFQNPPIL